jgi:hypothetical protein
MTTTVTRIDDNVELMVQGLPQSHITPLQEAKTTLALLQLGINGIGEASAGLLGGVRRVTLRIGREFYTLTWSLRVLRPLTALEVSSLAVKYIEEKVADGTFDEAMSNVAREYIYAMFTNEFDPAAVASRKSLLERLLSL